jgi:MAC/Perforin domain-containing protein
MDAPFMNPMDFGKGVFALDLAPRRSAAVVGSGFASVLGSAGSQEVHFSLEHATTFSQFQSAFTFSEEAAGRYGLFHGDGAYNFSQSQKYNSFTHYLIVRVDVLNQFKSIQDPRLNDTTDGPALLAAGGSERFLEEFGDHFVSGIRQGGVYIAVLSFSSETESDFKSESANIQLGITGFVDSETQFTSSLQTFKGSTNLKVNSFQNGGTDSTPAISIDDIIRKAVGFPNEVRNSAQSISVVLESYRVLSLPKPPDVQTLENAKQVIDRLGRLRNRFVQMLNDVEYIRDNPRQFIDVDKFDANGASEKLIDALNKLAVNAAKCANDVTKCEFVAFELPTITMPARIPDEAAALAQEGARIAKLDPLCARIRTQEPELSRRGFDIGMALNPTDLAQGPGKEKFKLTLPAVEQAACQRGIDYHIDRNFAGSLVAKGTAVIAKNTAARAFLDGMPSDNGLLGFTIAAGQFGSVSDGGGGDPDLGGGSLTIRNRLSMDTQKGFDAAVTFFKVKV